MKPALYLALLLANFLQQPSGPTAITPGGHSIFYAGQQGHIVWHADGSYICEGAGSCAAPTAQEIKQHSPVTDWPVIVGTSIAEGPTQTSLRIDKTYGPVVIVESQTSRIERLTSTEYAGLQKLRQAVAGEETRIAKAHGVEFFRLGHVCTRWAIVITESGPYCETHDQVSTKFGDSYEFRGQFLLINVPDAAPESRPK